MALTSFKYEISCPGNAENATIEVGEKHAATDWLNDTDKNFGRPLEEIRTEVWDYAARGWVAGELNAKFKANWVGGHILALKDLNSDFPVKYAYQNMYGLGMYGG
jgi:hypothetical protein